MSSPTDFTMIYNFKLVYTNVVYCIEISSHATLHDLFDEACVKFTPHINLHKYYIDYVVAGQDNSELASAVGLDNLYEPLWYEFGDKWRQVSFYVRPMDRDTEEFVCMDSYNEALFEQVPELNRPTDILGVNLPPPPGLTRQV